MAKSIEDQVLDRKTKEQIRQELLDVVNSKIKNEIVETVANDVIETFDKYTLVEFELKTGRTHQIRGYFSHIGHPIINDEKYGKGKTEDKFSYKGYFLTAYKLKFNLRDELNYLNELNIEITPSWINQLSQIN